MFEHKIFLKVWTVANPIYIWQSRFRGDRRLLAKHVINTKPQQRIAIKICMDSTCIVYKASRNDYFFTTGIGISTLLISFLCSTYYIVILAWGLYYMYASVAKEIPWGSCLNVWNTDRYSHLCFKISSVWKYTSFTISMIKQFGLCR